MFVPLSELEGAVKDFYGIAREQHRDLGLTRGDTIAVTDVTTTTTE